MHGNPRITSSYNMMTAEKDLLIAEDWVSSLKGKATCIWAKASLLRDAKGNILGAIESFRDITEQKRAEAQLRYQAGLVENITDAVISVDTNVVIQSWNKAAERMYGWNAGEIVGRPLSDIFPLDPGKATTIRDVEAELRKNGFWQGEVTQRRRDNTEFIVFTSVTWIWGEAGKPTGVVSVNYDISEKKRSDAERERLEEQLRQAQRLESVGRLAAGIAHDFNNLLMPIIGYAELILMDTKSTDASFEGLKQIKKAAERAKDLTGQLLAYGRKQLLSMQPHDLRELVADLEPLLRRTIPECISLVLDLSPRRLHVKADAVQIQQMLMNLVLNARDAIDGAGTIAIEMREESLDERFVLLHPEITAGSYAVLAVSDTGCGMDADTQEHIFEPFYTTKEKGKGTGLGLSTVFGIVKQHGGSIAVNSELGLGSIFRIYLPVQSCDVEMLPPEEEVEQQRASTEGAILLVEDNKAVRDLTASMLIRLGYKVVSAECPEKALGLAAKESEVIDLVLTDVVMPAMSGNELCGRLLALRPELKILYMSGYTEDTIAHHGVLDEGVHFIQKPFSTKTLRTKLREILG